MRISALAVGSCFLFFGRAVAVAGYVVSCEKYRGVPRDDCYGAELCSGYRYDGPCPGCVCIRVSGLRKQPTLKGRDAAVEAEADYLDYLELNE